MGSTTERSFLTSVLALDTSDRPAETVATALHALMTLTRARYGRAEVRMLGAEAPLLLVEPIKRRIVESLDSLSAPRCDIANESHDTGFATACLELHSRRRGIALTFHERELHALLFRALARLAKRGPVAEVQRSLHDATREFHAKLVADALHRAHGNVSHAARELRVTRAFVYKCLRAAATKKAS